MIICISANPAIDRRLRITELRVGEVNRALSARPAPGGKAAHVAMAARALRTEVLWVGFLGGGTGVECELELTDLGIPVEAVITRSPTRVNQEIIDATGRVTEILEPGGIVEEDEVGNMISVCERLFDSYNTEAQVVLSGSLPPGPAPTFYARLTEAAHARGCFVLLDTSGEALTASLASSPDLVKPNREEAETALGVCRARPVFRSRSGARVHGPRRKERCHLARLRRLALAGLFRNGTSHLARPSGRRSFDGRMRRCHCRWLGSCRSPSRRHATAGRIGGCVRCS